MYFRNLVLSAFVIAIFSAIFFSIYQAFFITPLILAAEVYEMAEPISHQIESDVAWEPADGLERNSWSFAANFLLCFAYSLILTSIMSIHSAVNSLKGLLWGIAAYLSVFVAPAIGLPPEIPGLEAGYLEGRQSWWIFTVLITMISLWLIAFKAFAHKVVGLVLIVTPHLITAPQPEIHGFVNTDAQAVSALSEIWQHFILQSYIGNGLLWLIIGWQSGYAVEKFIYSIGRLGEQHI